MSVETVHVRGASFPHVRSAGEDESFVSHELQKWLEAVPGVDMSTSELSFQPSTRQGLGTGVFAGCAVPSGGLIASVPSSLLLSLDTVVNLEPFAGEFSIAWELCYNECGQGGMEFPPAVHFWLYLIYARHRADTPHHAYIRQMPWVIDTLCMWTDDELKELEGSGAYLAALGERLDAWSDFKDFVRPLTEVDPLHFPAELFSFRAMLWARSVCTSRALPVWLAGDDAASHPSAEFVLCPLLDIFNHSAGAPIQWRAASKAQSGGMDTGIEFRLPASAVPVAAGDEIWNDYGEKSNPDLLLNYGFCTEGNELDRVEVLLCVSGAKTDLMEAEALFGQEGVDVVHRKDQLITLGPFTLGPSPRAIPQQLIAAVALCTWLCCPETQCCVHTIRCTLIELLEEAFQLLPPRSRQPLCRLTTTSSRRRALARTYLEGQRALLLQAIAWARRAADEQLQAGPGLRDAAAEAGAVPCPIVERAGLVFRMAFAEQLELEELRK